MYDAYVAGAWLVWWTPKTLYWVAKPTVHTEPTGNGPRPHRTDGPALECDVEDLYFLHGVLVDQAIVETAPEDMGRDWLAQHFVRERNVEVRREILRKLGAALFVERMGGKVLDREGEVYELLAVNLAGRTVAAKYLKMRNPSIGCWHVEGVPDDCKTVAEALHSRKPPALRALPIAEDGAEWWQQGDLVIWDRNAKTVKPRPVVLT